MTHPRPTAGVGCRAARTAGLLFLSLTSTASLGDTTDGRGFSRMTPIPEELFGALGSDGNPTCAQRAAVYRGADTSTELRLAPGPDGPAVWLHDPSRPALDWRIDTPFAMKWGWPTLGSGQGSERLYLLRLDAQGFPEEVSVEPDSPAALSIIAPLQAAAHYLNLHGERVPAAADQWQFVRCEERVGTPPASPFTGRPHTGRVAG